MPELSAPLRVGYITKRFPRTSETFIAQEVLELERRGVEVHVFQLHQNDTERPHAWLKEIRAVVERSDPLSLGNTWDAMRVASTEDPVRSRSLRRALLYAFEQPSGRKHLADALFIAHAAHAQGIRHLHSHFANRPAETALLVHLLSGIPFSFTAHAKDIFSTGPNPVTWRRLIRHARFAVTVAEANREYLVRTIGGDAGESIRLLYNGVDLESICPHPRETAGAPRVLCVARLIEKKGIDCLLEALQRMNDPAMSCEIVGEGPEADRLRDRAAVLGIGDRVRFLGSLPHEEVVRKIQESDLFVLPCRVAADGDRDALPTVLLEAMAAGLACISTPVGGVPEIVESGRTGLLVPQDDAAALAGALDRLGADPAERARMGEAGRRRAEALFDRRANVATLHRWFIESAESAGANESQEPSLRRTGSE